MPDPSPKQRVQRAPALPVAIAFASGVLCDFTFGFSLDSWLIAVVGSVVAAIVMRFHRFSLQAAILVLTGVACLGGARHHLFNAVARPDDVTSFVQQTPRPVRLVGRVASSPVLRRRERDSLLSAWPQEDDAVCLLDCRAIRGGDDAGGTDGDAMIEVSGTVRLRVSGALRDVEIGDVVQVDGWLSRARGPSNPGEFDFRAHLLRRGVRCLVGTRHPDAVVKLEEARTFSVFRLAAHLRERAETLFERELSPENATIASALLLGDRSGLTVDDRERFAESGMMHVLAVSGLHVGILAVFFIVACRLLRLPPLATSLVLVFVVAAYAVVTEGRPPVVRAAVLVFLTALGRPWHRQTGLTNTLAVSGLVVLAIRPTDLFDPGARLSFLAVASIIWSSEWSRRRIDVVEVEASSRTSNLVAFVLDWMKRGYLLVIGVWLFTAPLVAAQFHLVSPVGVLINVVLIPLVVLVLWSGYLFLFVGLCVPALAFVPGTVFDQGLGGLLYLVEQAAALDMGHRYVPGPPGWWLAGYYGLLAVVLLLRSVERLRLWNWTALCTWTSLGLATGLTHAPGGGLRCTFLSVGHGLAVLIETPDGGTLLFDAGAIDDGRRAQQIVQSALWERGRSRIDAVVVSHADIDHFNAVPGLLEDVPVGAVLMSPTFLDFDQPTVVRLCDAVSRERTPIKLIGAGDRIRLDDDVVLEILHPRPYQESSRDNANSVVMQITYAGRRVLLTGDVDESGLDALLETPERKVDVLLAPHHGGLKANTLALSAWARPSHVVASGDRRRKRKPLKAVYGPDSTVHVTAHDGAVTVQIRASGGMTVRDFLATDGASR